MVLSSSDSGGGELVVVGAFDSDGDVLDVILYSIIGRSLKVYIDERRERCRGWSARQRRLRNRVSMRGRARKKGYEG
jgi:hypothetical protein